MRHEKCLANFGDIPSLYRTTHSRRLSSSSIAAFPPEISRRSIRSSTRRRTSNVGQHRHAIMMSIVPAMSRQLLIEFYKALRDSLQYRDDYFHFISHRIDIP
jgi:hypothetical protein